ncbi:Protein kinase superfamily protein [Striga hermonthica]|uniref:Protein kinase superfamily protein n=1 Tax=Striga hermonthica TaxID=68872 RepID=A0A9N7NVF6_STRHE|nr:Protein kinase superfamily protein [Striga hermonthica]
MGACLSIEGEEDKSSSNKPDLNDESASHAKGNTGSSNSIMIIPRNIKDLRVCPGNGDIDIFTYEEMKLASRNFRLDQVLGDGDGGFGIVYKGVIEDNVRPGYKSTTVAIKELDPHGLQGDREWMVKKPHPSRLLSSQTEPPEQIKKPHPTD